MITREEKKKDEKIDFSKELSVDFSIPAYNQVKVASQEWVEENFVRKVREKDPHFFMNDLKNIGHCEECPRNIKMKDISKLPCGRYTCAVGKELE